MANSGYLAYTTLEEYFIDSPTTLTGRVKPNVSSDPDFIAPVVNTSACPTPANYSTLTASKNGSRGIKFTSQRPFSVNVVITWEVYSNEYGGNNGSMTLTAGSTIASNTTAFPGAGTTGVYIAATTTNPVTPDGYEMVFVSYGE